MCNVVADKYRCTPEYDLVREELIRKANNREIVAYMTIARLIGIEQPGNHMAREVGHVLGEISEDEVNQRRPMLSAVVVRDNDEYPGDGFFTLARQKNLLAENTELAERTFWENELNAVYQEWETR
jgi:alkylated DNA nucleotide flippase Atl1